MAVERIPGPYGWTSAPTQVHDGPWAWPIAHPGALGLPDHPGPPALVPGPAGVAFGVQPAIPEMPKPPAYISLVVIIVVAATSWRRKRLIILKTPTDRAKLPFATCRELDAAVVPSLTAATPSPRGQDELRGDDDPSRDGRRHTLAATVSLVASVVPPPAAATGSPPSRPPRRRALAATDAICRAATSNRAATTNRRALAAANAPPLTTNAAVLAATADHLPSCAPLPPLAHRINRVVLVVSRGIGDEIGGERAGPVSHRASISRSQADLSWPRRRSPSPSDQR